MIVKEQCEQALLEGSGQGVGILKPIVRYGIGRVERVQIVPIFLIRQKSQEPIVGIQRLAGRVD